MHDELTRVDMEKLRQELAYRENELMPKILEDVKTAEARLKELLQEGGWLDE